MASFCAVFFSTRCLACDLIESVSEGFPTYSYLQSTLIFCKATDIFYATKENNVAQFKVKVEISE